MKPFSDDLLLAHVMKTAARYSAIHRCILFGSRAAGRQKTESDYDIAVVAPGMAPSEWGAFAQDVVEEKPVLNSVDLVRVDLAGQGMQKKIKSEGIVFYEKSGTKLS